MKHLSLYLLKNSFGSKMKKGFRNLCTGESSTSTLHQRPPPEHPQPTLEEMIMQLEVEEKISRGFQHRMSCVDSADILRSARNALNQYPRFSLDGKDSMYRSSFGEGHIPITVEKVLPAVVGGERVVWCKPGVVGRLMGLEAMPVPLNRSFRRERLSAIIKKQNLRKRAESERRRAARREAVGSCSRMGYRVELDVPLGEVSWSKKRFS